MITKIQIKTKLDSEDISNVEVNVVLYNKFFIKELDLLYDFIIKFYNDEIEILRAATSGGVITTYIKIRIDNIKVEFVNNKEYAQGETLSVFTIKKENFCKCCLKEKIIKNLEKIKSFLTHFKNYIREEEEKYKIEETMYFDFDTKEEKDCKEDHEEDSDC